MDAEIANIPFLTALTGALRRCSSLVWLATPHSERLALHPASTAKNGSLAISASLKVELCLPYGVSVNKRITYQPYAALRLFERRWSSFEICMFTGAHLLFRVFQKTLCIQRRHAAAAG